MNESPDYPHLSLKRCIYFYFFLIPGAIGPRSGPGAGKKAGYGSGKQTLRLKANGTAAIEEVDNSRSLAEENINKLLENFMGINDSELGREISSVSVFCIFTMNLFQPLKSGTWRRGRPTRWSWPRPSTARTSRRSGSQTTSSSSSGARSQTPSPGGGRRSITTTSRK